MLFFKDYPAMLLFQMALLFERDRTVIQRHIRNIYSEGELIRDTTSAKFAHMGKDEDASF